MTKILVTGANGQLGSEIQKLQGESGYKFLFTDIEELNLSDNNAVDSFIKDHQPDYVINAAGYTAVDKAESEPDRAFEVNYSAVLNLVEALSLSGGKLIHISTDYVFDGGEGKPYPESYPAMPLSVYGRSKLAGEEIATTMDNSLVIRTSWLYSSFGKNFVKTIARLSQTEKELRVVDDQVGSPTWAADLAEAIITMIRKDQSREIVFKGEILNFCNIGECSWYDLASEIVNSLGQNVSVIPISTNELSQPATRPGYSVLDTSLIKEKYSMVIPGWKESLRKCLLLIQHSI